MNGLYVHLEDYGAVETHMEHRRKVKKVNFCNVNMSRVHWSTEINKNVRLRDWSAPVQNIFFCYGPLGANHANSDLQYIALFKRSLAYSAVGNS